MCATQNKMGDMKKSLWTPAGGVVETSDAHVIAVDLSLGGVSDGLNEILSEHSGWSSTQSVWAMRCLQLLGGIETEVAAVKKRLMAAAQEAGVSAPQVADMAQVSEATARKARADGALPPSIDPKNPEKPLWAIEPEEYATKAAHALPVRGKSDNRADRSDEAFKELFGAKWVEKNHPSASTAAEAGAAIDEEHPAEKTQQTAVADSEVEAAEEPAFTDVSLFEDSEEHGKKQGTPDPDQTPEQEREALEGEGVAFERIGGGHEPDEDTFTHPYAHGNVGEIWAVTSQDDHLGTISLGVSQNDAGEKTPTWEAKIRHDGKVVDSYDAHTFTEATRFLQGHAQ